MARLLYLVTDPVTADSFLRGHLAYMREQGFDVHLAAAPGRLLQKVQDSTGVAVHEVPFRREISPWADLKTMARLVSLMKRLAPDLINASTPKAGLLGLLAARLVGVPHRVYLVRGLRFETVRGPRRWLLKMAERLAARSATRVFAVSDSLKRAYAEFDLSPRAELTVLGKGSSNGVSTERFAPALEPGAREVARHTLGITPEAPVVGFVGRLTRDKGIGDLVEGFTKIVLPALPHARLVLIGDFEEGDPVSPATRRSIEAEKAILVHPFVPGLSVEYAGFDVLAFPSYREGFPNAPLEAAACGLPVVGYRATGTIDAVVHGLSGTLVDVGDVEALGAGLLTYLESAGLRREHGEQGLRRAREDFSPPAIWRAWRNEYFELLGRPD